MLLYILTKGDIKITLCSLMDWYTKNYDIKVLGSNFLYFL